MTQEPTESKGFKFDDEIVKLLDEARAEETAKQEAESTESERMALITDYLKSPDSLVVCLSYPDGSRNQSAINLFKAGQLDGMSKDLDFEDVISKEQLMYAAALELFDASDNFIDERFSLVSEGKKQLIAIWMNMRDMPFSSNWVSLLRNILPGGDVSEEDIDKKTAEIIKGNQELAIAIEEIAKLFADEHGSALSIDGAIIREEAKEYVESALNIVYKVMSGNITKGELNYQIIQLQADFAISSATQLECLQICAELCDIDINEHI